MKKIKNTLKNKRGQAAIFILMLFSLIFMFFGMAINVGMLVHHKMNLQNAADMAALSAAGEQARILNIIGWKNYELRKNFKYFLYEYWVEYNDRHQYFPDPRPQYAYRGIPNLSYRGRWTKNPSRPLAVPSFCAGDIFPSMFGGGDFKSCEAASLPGTIVTPPAGLAAALGALDPVTEALLTSLENMAQQKQAQTNELWRKYGIEDERVATVDTGIFRIRSENIYSTYLNTNREGSLPWIMNHAGTADFPQGRPPSWRTLEQMALSTTPGRASLKHYVNSLLEVPRDFDVLARLTAQKNLNLGNQEGFTFTTLRPDQYVRLRPIRPNFSVFWTRFEKIGGNTVPNRLQEIRTLFYTAVAKDPAVKTFYALMLTSTPDLPFLPGLKPWKLTAISAAQPFGSRIGPVNDSEDNYKSCIPDIGRCVPAIPMDEQTTLDDTQVLYTLKSEGMNYEAVPDPHRYWPILTPNNYEATRFIFQTPETSSTQHHWTDEPIPTTGAFTTNYTVTDPALLSTSWNNRRGYSMKLVPISSVLPYLPSQYQDSLHSILH